MQERLPVITSSANKIPSNTDWGDIAGDFDASDAYRKFYGLPKQEAKKLFVKDALSCAQDLRFMPSIPFLYYFEEFCEFVLTEVYGDNPAWAVADSFISVLTSRVEVDPKLLVSNLPLITKVLRFLVRNQQSFGATEPVYGDFYVKSKSILESITGDRDVLL
jgi:hypothetical protein